MTDQQDLSTAQIAGQQALNTWDDLNKLLPSGDSFVKDRVRPLLDQAVGSSLSIELQDGLIAGWTELSIGGSFVSSSNPCGVTLKDLGDRLRSLAGPNDNDWLSEFPVVIREPLNNICLSEVYVKLVFDASGVDLTFLGFTLGFKPGFSVTTWKPLGNLITISLDSLQFRLNDPLNSLDRRAVWARFSGTLTLESWNLPLKVTVEAPELLITTEYVADADVDKVAKALQDLPALPGPGLQQLRLTAAPGRYYSFLIGMSLPLKWDIQSKPTSAILTASMYYNVPLAKTDAPSKFPISGWHFDASFLDGTGAGGISIDDLFNQLAADTKTFPSGISAPTAIKALALNQFSLDYDIDRGEFAFSATGTLKLEAGDCRATISLKVEKQTDDTYKKTFGGYLTFTLESGEALEFDLVFQTGQQAKMFLARYQDPQGVEALSVKKLVALASPSASSSIPESLKLTLQQALYAYINAETPAKSRHLFGLDFSAGIDLTEIHLPSLPFISANLPADQRLELAFRLLAVSDKFSPGDITALDGLARSGLGLPPDGIGQVEIQTTLKMGGQKKQLNLPVSRELSSDLKPGETSVPNAAAANQVTAAGNDDFQWISLQKKFGPLYFERAGFKISDAKLFARLDAALTVNALKIALDGLSMESPVNSFKPSFSLNGLSIQFQSGELEIGGSFVRQEGLATGNPAAGNPANNNIAYGGMAMIRAGKLSISAIGSYTTLNGDPSLFLYAVLDYPIGGPAFFFVTGLAAGFGYNRRLIPPDVRQVDDFPLVAQVRSSDTKLPVLASQKDQQTELTKRLASLAKYVPPETGQYFLVAGVHFTSFKIIDSFVMLAFQFGRQMEINLLGSSLLIAPGGSGAQTPVAKARLNIEARYLPHEGFLTVRGELAKDSYILSENCHLQGGFAFYAWFKDKQGTAGLISAGDFCLTLGGYHPKYIPPAHYPQVPRLGISWQVSDKLSIKGGAYFALTPHAIMAGGNFEANWQDGAVRAWFKAGLDFLLSWQPYHYDARAYVSIGASYTFKTFWGSTATAKGELGADVHVWGPNFALTAEVDFYIFSVKVEYNTNQPQTTPPIEWAEFSKAFLPAPSQVCAVNVISGLVYQSGSGANTKAIMDFKKPAFAINTAIPVNHVILGKDNPTELLWRSGSNTLFVNKDTAQPVNFSYDSGQKKFKQADSAKNRSLGLPGILPMQKSPDQVDSQITISILHQGEDVTSRFDFSPLLKSVPTGMWGKPGDIRVGDPNPVKGMLLDTLMGFEVSPTPVSSSSEKANSLSLNPATPTSRQINLQWETSMGRLVWTQADQQTLNKPVAANVAERRAALLGALGMGAAPFDFSQQPDSLAPLMVEGGALPAAYQQKG